MKRNTVIIGKDALISMGNSIGLMPMTSEGWIFLAEKYFENPREWIFKISYYRDGTPKVTAKPLT